QLVKHFGSKEGLLEAVFEDGWAKLRMQLASLQTIAAPRKQLKVLMHMVIQLFAADHQLRDLMLLEGRRIRREGKMIMLTRSYMELIGFVDSLVQKAQEQPQGPKKPAHPAEVVRSSLIGLFECVLRDQAQHE